jgi:putative RecB family exonuclease
MSSTLYSHSRLSSYENCPFQYKLKYVDRVQAPLGTTIEAFVGSRVHDALEWLYRLARDGRVATKEELVQKYQALWEAKWEDEIRVIKQELEVEHYRSNGQKWVEQYWDRYQPFDQGITIDLECKVFIDLPGGGKVMGYIDRLEKVGNKHFVIHDYKTSGKLPTPHATKNDRQLALYMLGIKQRYPDLKKIDLVWHFVRFDEDVWSQRTDEQLQEMAEQTASLIETVDAAVERKDLPTKTSALCDWCEFRPLCPEFANLYEMENQEETLLASVITASEASALVDELVSLRDEKQRITGEMDERTDEIREKLRAYSAETGHSSIYGAEHYATVSTTTSVDVPKAGSEPRLELELVLKSLGLWDQVDQLSSSKLKKLADSDALADDQREAVNKYLAYSEHPRVKLRKRN